MWKGYENALKFYFNTAVKIWISRGYKNTMKPEIIRGKIILPKWFGNKKFHDSHKSNLLRKKPEHYFEFSKKVPNDLDYVWP